MKSIAYGHLGEIVQGALARNTGNPMNFLMSLPAPRFYSSASFEKDNTGEIKIFPRHKTKAKMMVKRLFEVIKSNFGGTIHLQSNIPVGKGAGSSTADCVASIKAATKSIGHELNNRELASLLIECEGASDSTFPGENKPIFFAQCEGKILEIFDKFPDLCVTAFDTDTGGTVNTLSMDRPCYSSFELGTFRVLRTALKRAIETQDFDLLASCATRSAVINNQFLPKKNFEKLLRFACTNNIGLVVAHSGTLAAFVQNREWMRSKASKIHQLLDQLQLHYWDYSL